MGSFGSRRWGYGYQKRTTVEECLCIDVRRVASDLASLGMRFYQLAEASLDAALAAEGGKERKALTLAAVIATDKWRLLTGQTASKLEVPGQPKYSDEELRAKLAETRAILATPPEGAIPRGVRCN